MATKGSEALESLNPRSCPPNDSRRPKVTEIDECVDTADYAKSVQQCLIFITASTLKPTASGSAASLESLYPSLYFGTG